MANSGALARLLEGESQRPLRWFVTLAALLAIQISPWWVPTPDAAAYLSIARSIATRHELRMFGYSHVAYPPGYPVLISLAFLISPLPFLAISFMQWLMAIIFMYGLYQWTMRQAPAAALPLTGLAMVNVTFWIYYHRTLSELPFMMVAIWAVLFLDRTVEASTDRHGMIDLLIGTALLLFLTTIREVGILFATALAWAVYLRVRSGKLSTVTGLWIVTVVFLPAITVVAAFVMYNQMTFAATHVFGTHLSGFVDSRVPLLQRVLDGARLQVCAVGRLMIPGMFKAYGHRWLDINSFVYCPVFVLLAFGWWRWVRCRQEVYALAVPLYLAVYALWDFDADTRYLLPVLPALLISLWYLIEPYKKISLSLLYILFFLHLGVSLQYWAFVETPRVRLCNAQWSSVSTLAATYKNRPGPIAADRDVPQCARLMLSFLLNRPILDLRVHPSSLSETSWLLAWKKELPVDGFRTESAEGDYALLIRDRPVAKR